MSLLDDLVREELEKLSDRRKAGPSKTFILCPFHPEKTPSGRVLHRPDGVGTGNYKCYGCGSTATWNQLAKILGLRQYGKSAALQDSLNVPHANLEGYDARFLSGEDPDAEDLRFYELDNEKRTREAGIVAGKWRGFRLDFLQSLGIKLVRVVETGRYYIHLPIQVRGVEKGYIKAQIRKPNTKEIPSYINSKGSWSLKWGLFPYDQSVALMKSLGLSTLFLVEGPRDALRLIRFGIPAICIMGTHSWCKAKLRQLEFSGASRIVVMMDGDAAGRAATKLITLGVNKEGDKVTPRLDLSFNTKVIRLWNHPLVDGKEPNYDPGNCPTELLIQAKRLLR